VIFDAWSMTRTGALTIRSDARSYANKSRTGPAFQLIISSTSADSMASTLGQIATSTLVGSSCSRNGRRLGYSFAEMLSVSEFQSQIVRHAGYPLRGTTGMLYGLVAEPIRRSSGIGRRVRIRLRRIATNPPR
jgi:hypothetical protein